jgi:hypothetical protein
MTIVLSEGETKQLNVSLQPKPVLPATLTGIVTDSVTRNPIAGVLVELNGELLSASTYTGSDGSYTIGNIPPGSYSVRFSHPDYQTLEV